MESEIEDFFFFLFSFFWCVGVFARKRRKKEFRKSLEIVQKPIILFVLTHESKNFCEIVLLSRLSEEATSLNEEMYNHRLSKKKRVTITVMLRI